MLTPTEDYNWGGIFFFFIAKSWRLRIRGYKLRYNRAAGGKHTKNRSSLHTCTYANHAASSQITFIVTGNGRRIS